MATKKITVKVNHEVAPEHEVAAYANVVSVSGGSHEVYLTFLQVIMPTAQVEQTSARSVARVAVPVAVAQELCKLLSEVQS